MKIIKSLFPILFLLGLSFYAFYQHTLVPSSFIRHAIFLPPVLALIAVGLSIHFNRGPIFFYVSIILITYSVLARNWLASDLSYSLFSGCVPFLVLLGAVVPERRILSLRAIPVYIVPLGIVLLITLKADALPSQLASVVLKNWLPPRYFDWTLLSQSALASSILVFLCMLVLSFMRTSTHIAAGLGIMLMLVVILHHDENIRSQVIFSSAALMMCLYAIVQESWRMAYLDELTELPARRALREKFRDLSGVYTLAMIDVDHFKKFNDNYGHDTGDDVLRMIASRLHEVGGAGLPYRYGGEEFAIIFNGKDKQDVKHYLEDLRRDIARSPFILQRQERRGTKQKSANRKNKTVQVTVSIGCADSGSRSTTPWDVLKRADKALYRAKKKGRDRVCC